jgi:hypothetical protein
MSITNSASATAVLSAETAAKQGGFRMRQPIKVLPNEYLILHHTMLYGAITYTSPQLFCAANTV